MLFDFETGLLRKENEVLRSQEPQNLVFKLIKSVISPRRQKANALIIHVHGGGFVSMSSGSHQTYTRLWANELSVPIFSIDYRLAPQDQFPAALNDVWQVYYWLVLNAESTLGINPAKIILVGDSAGGNLVSALTTLCIERKFRKPDGLILCYPAMSLSKLRFTPSVLLAVDDQLLPYPFLKMCLDSYVGDFIPGSDCDPSVNHYLSPCLTKPEILQYFPVTRVMVA